MPHLALDLLASIITVWIDAGPAFFSAFHALAIDRTHGGTGLPPHLLSALEVERIVDLLQRAIIVPAAEIVMSRAFRRQVVGQGTAIGNPCSEYTWFAAAELRLGGDPQQKVRIVRTDGRPRS